MDKLKSEDLLFYKYFSVVEIDTFKRFNKIKALTHSSEVIAESVSKSDLFEVSDLMRKMLKFVCLYDLIVLVNLYCMQGLYRLLRNEKVSNEYLETEAAYPFRLSRLESRGSGAKILIRVLSSYQTNIFCKREMLGNIFCFTCSFNLLDN